MKIQTKITLLFFSISTIGLILLNASIFYFVSEFNFEDFFERLESRVNLAARINIYPNSSPETYHEIRTRYLEKLEDEKDYIIKLDPSKKEGFKRPLDLPEKFYSNILNRGKDRFSDRNRFYAGALFNTSYGQYIVIVAASDPYGFKELADLKKVLAISFFVSIILAFIAGKVFSHYTIKPVGAIISSVKSITANNLHSRLDEVKGKDEIAELAHTFNNMLTRLETAFETQNNFVSNASHELRTPLAIITSETEYLLSRPGLSKEAEKSAQAVLAEAGKLEHILTSLLGLAQSGFDGKKQNWQKIRVDELIWQVVDSVKKIEPDSIIDIDYSALPDDESRLCIDGNVNLLHLAVSNIVMNGCKYSNNQPVRIKIITESNMVIISVTDQGIGIPKQEQQHVFEPFFRASNTSEFEGYGIGLPLTLNIIRLHKGSIGIRSEEKMGTEMQILLPCSA